MKNVAIIGATGLVGQQLLNLLLGGDQFERVHSIGRRKVESSSPKLVQHVCSLESLGEVDPGEPIDIAFCTLGTTIKVAGSQQAFAHVDRDYVCNFAHWAKKQGTKVMAVNSALGADASSRNFYLRTKGEMEQCLVNADFDSLTIVRPSLLVPTGRMPKRTGEEIAYKLLQVFGWIMVGPARRYRAVRPVQVARVLISGATGMGPGIHIIESEAITGKGAGV